MFESYPILYKLDTKGKVREWRAEVDGAKYRVISGLREGKKVISEWKETFAKNVGRSNATTAEEQAISEVESLYTKQKDKGYTEKLSEVKTSVKFFKPMLADKWENRKDKIEYPVYVQPKLDGIRCIANKDGLWSRQGKRIIACPHIEEDLKKLFAQNPDVVLDGELYNHEYRDDFNKIVSMVRKTKPTAEDLEESAEKVEYHVYDFPSMGEKNFHTRSISINRAISKYCGPSISIVDTQVAVDEETVDEVYGEYLEDGYEGGIIRANTPYEQKRSKNLLKRKDFQDAEYYIVGIEEGTGNWKGYAKRIIFQLDSHRTATATLKGTQEYCKQVLKEKQKYIGGQVTVQYFQLTPDGVPRFPVAKALYEYGRDV